MIESVRLQRFKNFPDATLKLGPLTVIVGANASGKSNIRDAFRFIHGMSRGYSLAEIIGEKYVEGGVLQWKGIRGGTREAASFGEDRFTLTTTVAMPNDVQRTGVGGTDKWDATHVIDVSPRIYPFGPIVVREALYDNGGMVYDSHPSVNPPTQGDLGALMVRGESSPNVALPFPATEPVLSHLLRTGAPRRTLLPAKCFMQQLAAMRFLDLAPSAMRIPSIPGQVVLGDRGENLSSVLQAICADENAKKAVAEWIRELTPMDVVDFEFVPDQTGRILVSLVDSHGQRTPAYSASDGTLRFLAMIAALLGPDAAQFYASSPESVGRFLVDSPQKW